MSNALPAFLSNNEPATRPTVKGRKRRLPFLDNTMHKLAELIRIEYGQADTASRTGVLQKLDARTKLVFLISFVVLISFQRHILDLFFCLLIILALYPLSGLNLIVSLKKAFWPSFFFGFVVISPAMLNIVSGGEIKLKLFQFESEHNFWIYHIPASIGISAEGIQLVTKLFLKISNSILLSLLIISTTAFAEIIKAMKMLKVPDLVLLSITLSYKFIFVLAKTTEETYFSMRLKWIKYDTEKESGKIIAGRIGYVFRKSWTKYEEIYKAMIARGFTGRVNLCYPGKFHIQDIIFCVVMLGFYSIFIYLEYFK